MASSKSYYDQSKARSSAIAIPSGTTGNPKGVVYSHRSNVLHAMTVAGADAFSIHARNTVMTVGPMFHANARWLTFSCPMAGAKLVMQSVNILISPMRHDQCIG